MIIAVDGPAASGKGTLAKGIARRYGLRHLDTGRTYRAVALALREGGFDYADAKAAIRLAGEIDFDAIDEDAINSAEIGDGASKVAVLPDVRAVLVARQRAFATEAQAGAVLDGRDIGTVVCPDAHLKFYVVATPEERARRRALELYGSAEGEPYEALLAMLRERDARDTNRATSPLRPAADAHILDTTKLTIEEAFAAATALVENARKL
ncbi:MAG: (d)CMP kinase [Pseudomonadota bacterium]